MKRFLLRILKFSIAIYAVLWCIQLSVDYGLRLSKDVLYHDWNSTYDGKINADIVFFGSSRTLKHYDPEIFDAKLNMYSYNLGSNGTAIDLERLRVKAYLENNKAPKIILQNVDITSLISTKELYEKEQYFPYFTLDNYRFLDDADSNICMEYAVPMLKYRGYYYKMFGESIKSYLGKSINQGQLNRGFHGSELSWTNEFKQRVANDDGTLFDFSHVNFNQRFLVFEELLGRLKETKALIFLVWSPTYYERQLLEKEALDKIKSEFENIDKNNKNVHFIDFTNDKICRDKMYFYNSYHLNKKGATIFSNQLADSITKYYKREFKN